MQALVLALLAVVSAWTPPATWALAGVMVAMAATGLLLLGTTVRGGVANRRWLLPVTLWVLLGMSTGWDRGQALMELALTGLLLAIISAASRTRPTTRGVRVLLLGISLLAIWALWQVLIGFEMARQALPSLPAGLMAAARFRLDTGRAFASQAQPGHLAVLLATVVPLAGENLLERRHQFVSAIVLALAATGLLLTRSPLGMGLALLALLGLARGHRGTRFWTVPAAALAAFVTVLLLRPDLLSLQPIVWRLENWHNALWVWASSPVTGVGLGGFGQAGLAVPFAVANHPQHAHCLPLEWLAEMGIPGLILALLFYGWILKLARRLWQRDRGLAIALLVVPLHNLVDFSFFEPGIAVVWALLAGWGLALAHEDLPESRDARSRWLPVVAGTLAAAVFGLTFASLVAGRHAVELQKPRPALEYALRAFHLAPWRPILPALVRAADSAGQAGAGTLAGVLAEARWWRPHSAALASLSSGLASHMGDLPAAARDAWAAEIFTPLDRRTSLSRPPESP